MKKNGKYAVFCKMGRRKLYGGSVLGKRQRADKGCDNYGWMMHGVKVRKESYQRRVEKKEEYDLRIRRLQHDMKSHMLALLGMVQAKDTEGAAAYIRSL